MTENMSKVASERQGLQLLISSTLNDLDVFKKMLPLIESVMAQEAAEVQMKSTIEHERTTTAAVRQLRNDLRDEKMDHEDKVEAGGKELGRCMAGYTVIVIRDCTAVSLGYYLCVCFLYRCEKRRNWWLS